MYEFEGKRPQVAATAFVHPQAVLVGQVEIGENCYVGAGAVLRGDRGAIRVGSGTNIQDLCCIHAKPGAIMQIGENAVIAHGAILHGPGLIGDRVAVGMGAIISPECELGADCLLGAGAVLTPRKVVPPGKLLVGNPAVVVKDVPAETSASSRRAAENYQDLARRSQIGMKLI
jgi:carbonic anhydrase/acetyltransferase-like protein (isoleucine patch superfamily)